MVRFFSAAMAAVLLASTTQAYRPGDEICAYATSKSSCALGSITPSKTDGSVLIYPGGKTRCAFDDYTDEKTGYKSNATFFFQVFPKPQKKKLALILAGGGACIDRATCGFGLQCSLPITLMVANPSADSGGIFNASDPANPFSDWNIVHVPYCTGDLHIGNTVLDPYESGMEPALGRPQCLGHQKKTHLNGFQNTKAAFQWAKTNYPEVEELVIGGMSAGSLASQMLAAYVADMWSVEAKGVKYGVLPDSFIGAFPEDKPAGQVLNFYGACDVDIKLPASVAAKCKAETLTIPEITSSMMQLLPESAWLFITTMADYSQRLFYQLRKDGIAGLPFPNQISPDDLFAKISKILDMYKAVSKHVSTFVVSGSQHVFINVTTWQDVSTTGDELGKFTTNWLANIGTAKNTTIMPTSLPTVTPTVTPARPAC
jgi:hypothetical protein